MGNENMMCGCDGVRTDDRFPPHAVDPRYEQPFKEVYSQYLRYPERYAYMLSYMHSRGMDFVDEYFNGQREPEQVLGELKPVHLRNPVVWRKANAYYPKQNIRVDDTFPKIRNQQYLTSHSQLIDWIMRQPQIVTNIFRYESIPQQGLILVYLPVFGCHSDPLEVVIDSQLPMITKGGKEEYLFSLAPKSKVGGLLLEKALAKVLGSYEKLFEHSPKDIFEMTIGIPVLESQSTQQQTDKLSKYYQPGYHLASVQQTLEPHRSQYFKFYLGETSQVSLAVWQMDDPEYFELHTSFAEVIMELIFVDSSKGVTERVAYSSRLSRNKTLLRTMSPAEEKSFAFGRQFFNLKQGTYLLHIYLIGSQRMKANIVSHSDCVMNLSYRRESYDLNEHKLRMISHTFNLRGKDKQQYQRQTANIESLFLWDGFRGILLLRNTSTSMAVVQLMIKKEYTNQMKFEEETESSIRFQVGPLSRKLTSFVKITDKAIGNFYTIRVEQ